MPPDSQSTTRLATPVSARCDATACPRSRASGPLVGLTTSVYGADGSSDSTKPSQRPLALYPVQFPVFGTIVGTSKGK